MTDEMATAEEFKALMQDPAARQAFVEVRALERGRSSRTYAHVLRAVGSQPWAILPEQLDIIVDVLTMRAAGEHFSEQELEQRIGAARRPQRAPVAGEQGGGVAVIPIHGTIIPKANMLSEISGGTSIAGLRSMFREAMASSQVGAIVLDIDSPGGMVDQVPEMAAEIRAARGPKPIIAVANTTMASAAYYLGSQADEVVVTKSGRVGSIGVLSIHEDRSKAEEGRGVASSIISAGKFKAEGNPFEPLSNEARQHLQKMVDTFYGMFTNDVARARGVEVSAVRDGYGQGRMELARDAVKVGLADRVDTLEGVVTDLLASQAQGGDQAATTWATGGPWTTGAVDPVVAIRTQDILDDAAEIAAAAESTDDPAPATEDDPDPDPDEDGTDAGLTTSPDVLSLEARIASLSE